MIAILSTAGYLQLDENNPASEFFSLCSWRDCYARGTFLLPRRSSWEKPRGKSQPSREKTRTLAS